MWNDTTIELIGDLSLITNRGISNVPLVCPVCGSTTLHIYAHRFGNGFRGGAWAWCSICQCFEHVSCHIPEWWENCAIIDPAQLTALPDYLESNKAYIDQHLVRLLCEQERLSK